VKRLLLIFANAFKGSQKLFCILMVAIIFSPTVANNHKMCTVSNIGLFLCILFCISWLLFFDGSLSKVKGNSKKITVTFANTFKSVKEQQLLLLQ
jgi:hypothetical protein